MIKPTVTRHDMDPAFEVRQNVRYWLSKPPEERLAAVDELRKQLYGDSVRLQRTIRVVQREQS
jgi:hypothetical protein